MRTVSHSRRQFLRSTSLAMAGIASPIRWFPKALATARPPLDQFEGGDVVLTIDLHEVRTP